MTRFLSLLKGGLRASTLGLAASAGVAAVATPVTVHATPPADQLPGEAAVFARFSDLDRAATEDRLEEMLGSRLTSSVLLSISRQLAEGANASQIEGALLALIARRTPEQVETTLDAIMLDQYLGHVRPGLESGAMTVAEVFDVMLDRDEVLTTAAYGYTGPRNHGRRLISRR